MLDVVYGTLDDFSLANIFIFFLLLLSLLGSLTCKYMTKKKLFTTNTIMDPKWARCERDLKNHARHLPIFNIKNLCEQTY